MGRERRRLAWWAFASGSMVVVLAGMVYAILKGSEDAAPPARCPPDTLPTETRCCAKGQTEVDGRCEGIASTCPGGLEPIEGSCVATPVRVRIEPASVRLGPGDWEAQGLIRARTITVDAPFEIDAFEVTVHRWQQCVRAGSCVALSSPSEGGVPVRGVLFEQAERFCRWAQGDVPAEDAWILAAAGPRAHRYPWGDTGAVCRRADWGRTSGPCARGALSPEWAGLIAHDVTPEGVVGLAGGVAEWVRGANGPALRGGSFRSELATELRTWRRDGRPADRAYEDVGFRCTYSH